MIIRDQAQSLFPFSRLAMLPLLTPHILCLWIIFAAQKFKQQALQKCAKTIIKVIEGCRKDPSRSRATKQRFPSRVASSMGRLKHIPCDLLLNQHSIFLQNRLLYFFSWSNPQAQLPWFHLLIDPSNKCHRIRLFSNLALVESDEQKIKCVINTYLQTRRPPQLHTLQ